MFLIMYVIEIYREFKLIKYLDVNINIPNDSKDVENVLKFLPEEKKNKILYVHKYYKIIIYLLIFFYFINSLLIVLIIKNYYLNNTTFTTFITYILFMFFKLCNVYLIVNTDNNIFYSAFIKQNIQFNDVSEEYKNESITNIHL